MNLISTTARKADWRRLLAVGLLAVLLAMNTNAQVKAFPGAEGFGADATGGRGGSVIYVTNLNDSGTGSLRAAIQASGKRTVVFKVGGTITLLSGLTISNGDITIAGQTAPGDGITLRGYTLHVSANNVIIRYIRSRMGDETNQEDDAMNGRNRSNIILDHCSLSWSVDECGSFYDNTNFTMQYCLLSESLYASIHDKGNHGYGGIWGGKGASFHHNLLAHHTSRNPRFCGSRYSNLPAQEIIDHRNNVIYNWGDNSCYGAEGGSYNIVNNYYKYGPATASSIRDRIIHPDPDNGSNAQPAGVRGTFYIDGNYMYKNSSTTANNWNGVDGIDEAVRAQIELTSPVTVPALTEHSAEEAFEYVLANVGVVIPARDVLDQRIINETRTGTAHYGGEFRGGGITGIIDTQSTVGGWPTLQSGTAPTDSDSDGMPDAWEDANSLNKNDASDRNNDMRGEGYTNLEYYLNSLVEDFEFIVRPLHLAVDNIDGNEVTLTWDDISDNETGFVIERKTGDTWSEIITTAANATTYMDNGITENGDYYYRLKAVNSSVESFATDSVKAKIEHLGVANSIKIDPFALKVYPNPVNGAANASFALSEAGQYKISIMDITGKEIKSMAVGNGFAGQNICTLETSGLNNGVYFVKLEAENKMSLTKIVVTQ